MNNIAERAFKTFFEAFIPAIVAALAAADYTDLDTLPRVMAAILISAAATGISAVWNGIVQPMLQKNREKKIAEEAEEVFAEEFGDQDDSEQ